MSFALVGDMHALTIVLFGESIQDVLSDGVVFKQLKAVSVARTSNFYVGLH